MTSGNLSETDLTSIGHQLVSKYSGSITLSHSIPKNNHPDTTKQTTDGTSSTNQNIIDLINDAAVFSDPSDISRLTSKLKISTDCIDTINDEPSVNLPDRRSLIEDTLLLLAKARQNKIASMQRKQDNLSKIMAKLESLVNPATKISQERQSALHGKLRLLETHLQQAKSQVDDYRQNCHKFKSMVVNRPLLISMPNITTWLSLACMTKSMAGTGKYIPCDLRVVSEITGENKDDVNIPMVNILRLNHDTPVSMPGIPARSIVHSYLNSCPMIARHIKCSISSDRGFIATKLIREMSTDN